MTERTAPRPEPAAVYDEGYQAYRRLYPALRPIFHEETTFEG